MCCVRKLLFDVNFLQASNDSKFENDVSSSNLVEIGREKTPEIHFVVACVNLPFLFCV